MHKDPQLNNLIATSFACMAVPVIQQEAVVLDLSGLPKIEQSRIEELAVKGAIPLRDYFAHQNFPELWAKQLAEVVPAENPLKVLNYVLDGKSYNYIQATTSTESFEAGVLYPYEIFQDEVLQVAALVVNPLIQHPTANVMIDMINSFHVFDELKAQYVK